MTEKPFALVSMETVADQGATAPANRNERKVIHAAGVLVIQRDAALASTWRDELVDFGMAGVRTVESLQAAVPALLEHEFLGIVVAADTVSEASRAIGPLRDAAASNADAGDVPTPILLVLTNPTRANEAAARRLGYDAILPAPVHSRLIYRRMGSLMQKARRSAKLRSAPEQGGSVEIAMAAKADE